MKQLFISKYSCIAHPLKAVLRSMFRDLVHDSSSARTSEEATVDERVALALLNADDTDITVDCESSMENLDKITPVVYVKRLALHFREYAQMLSVDDKCIVPVGEPGDPISTGVRSHGRSLALSASTLAALDHDFHIHGIVPSVAFFVNIPEAENDYFFQGKPFVTLKDKVTQSSHALRHSAELASITRSDYSKDGLSKPLMILVSDSGPDHRLNFLSVQVALICLFMALDLDFLVCVRTCPYQSWQNMAERVMSTLNLALQNMSLCRKEMSPESEQLLRNKSTMKEVREVINSHRKLLSDLRDSMAPPMLAFSTRILALTIKEERFAIHSSASDPVVEEFFTHIHFIEPGLDRNHLRKADLKDAPALKAFMDTHCHMSQYVFKVKKCNDESCFYCTGHTIRMPKEVFDSVRFLDPTTTIGWNEETLSSFQRVVW